MEWIYTASCGHTIQQVLGVSPSLPQQPHTNVHPAVRAGHARSEPRHLRVRGRGYTLDECVPEVPLPGAGLGEQKREPGG